jgi:phosphate transport system substrate-binding protein
MKSLLATIPFLAVALLANFASAQSDLSGNIRIEGSSTVQPISNKAQELFNKVHPKVNIGVGGEGTGNGFKALASGECDISGASRPIKKKELDKVNAAGIKFIEVPVAYDGLTIVVNPKNDFIKSLTIDQLKKIFREDFACKTWKEVDPSWPDEKISLYIPGSASGTFDYFKEVIGKKDGKTLRSDEQVQDSEDDKMLVTGVKGEKFAIGFFGYSYFDANRDGLKAVPIVNPKTKKAVTPSIATIKSGEYAPFSRPLFIYVNVDSYMKLEVEEYVLFMFENLPKIVEAAGYVPLPAAVVESAQENVDSENTGSHFIDAKGEKRSGALEAVFVPGNRTAQK